MPHTLLGRDIRSISELNGSSWLEATKPGDPNAIFYLSILCVVVAYFVIYWFQRYPLRCLDEWFELTFYDVANPFRGSGRRQDSEFDSDVGSELSDFRNRPNSGDGDRSRRKKGTTTAQMLQRLCSDTVSPLPEDTDDASINTSLMADQYGVTETRDLEAAEMYLDSELFHNI